MSRLIGDDEGVALAAEDHEDYTKVDEDDGHKEGGSSEDDVQYEGGLFGNKKPFNPYKFVQSPLADGHTKKDLRIFTMFKTQVKVDFIFIRLVLIAGNLFLLIHTYIFMKPFQLQVQLFESILLSIVMMYLQTHILKNWEDHKLPFKMKDTKSNYLFKQLRLPSDLRAIEEYLSLKVDEDYMPEWSKYMPYYKLPEIFLDNKLEELLNIFGRRQCKSCIDFPTGTELEQDPRQNRSFPLSPKGEQLYAGLEGEFNLVDF